MSRPSRKPLDPDLYADVVAEAKARFDVWPSAYASGWVVKTYKARGGRYGGESKGSRTGLTKWFGESWVDLSRPIHDEDGELVGYEPCGRKKSSDHGDPADYPKCRPAKEAMRMSPAQVKDAIKRKRAAEAKAGRGAKGRGGRGARAPVRVATYRGNPEEDAAWLDRLAPPGRSSAIGPEKGRLKPDGVSKLVSPHGSVRYLYAEGGEVLAGLQVVTLDGVTGEATSVYTLPKARRRGIAEILARAAKKDFKSLGFSEHRTEAGSKWVAAVQGRENPVTTPPVFLDPDCRREPPKSGPFCLRCNKPLKDNQRRVHVFYTYDAERGFFGQFVSLQPPGEPALLGADCARALGLSARRNPAPVIQETTSPLQYHHDAPVYRLQVVDESAPPPDPRATYFAETTRTVRKGKNGQPLKTPRVEVTPGADEGVVAFLDYHRVPGQTDAIYIDYMSTRDDQQGKGHATALVDKLYGMFPDAAWIDWGDIMSDAAWRIFKTYRDASGVQSYGKLRNPEATAGGRGARAPVRVSTYRTNPIRGVPDDVIERYSAGGCLYLALALHDRFGWDIYAQIEDDPEYVAHAYVKTPHGTEVDILGEQDEVDVFASRVEKMSRQEFVDFVSRTSGHYDWQRDYLNRKEELNDVIDTYVLPAVRHRKNPMRQPKARSNPEEDAASTKTNPDVRANPPPVFLDPDYRREPPKSGPFCLRCNKPLKDNQRRVHVFYTYDGAPFVSLQPPGEPALLGADCARALGLSARRNPAPAPAARSKRVAAVQGRENPYDLEDDPLSDVYVIDTETLEDGTVVKYVESPFPYERKPLAHNDDPKVQAPVNLAYLIGTQRRVTVAGVEKYLAGIDEKPPRPGSTRMPAILVYETSDGRQYIADGHHRAFAALLRDMETFPAIIQFVRE